MMQYKHARNPETRRRTLQASESKLEINVPLLEKALKLRRKLAALQQYETWADYVEEIKMIKTGQAVKDVSFLDRYTFAFSTIYGIFVLVPGRPASKAHSCRHPRYAHVPEILWDCCADRCFGQSTCRAWRAPQTQGRRAWEIRLSS